MGGFAFFVGNCDGDAVAEVSCSVAVGVRFRCVSERFDYLSGSWILCPGAGLWSLRAFHRGGLLEFGQWRASFFCFGCLEVDREGGEGFRIPLLLCR
jgi:hypothetical protein